jgi:hypothetical protein
MSNCQTCRPYCARPACSTVALPSYFSATWSGSGGIKTLPAAPQLTLLPFNLVTAGNAAGAFSVSTSTFTAPRAGPYLFGAGLSIYTPTPNGASVGITFYKNNVPQTFTASLNSFTASPTQSSVSAGSSIIFDLQAGDVVNVYYTLIDASNQVLGSYFWGQPL